MKTLNFRSVGLRGMDCTGDARCTTEDFHKPGCPTLKADIAKWKANRAEHYAERKL